MFGKKFSSIVQSISDRYPYSVSVFKFIQLSLINYAKALPPAREDVVVYEKIPFEVKMHDSSRAFKKKDIIFSTSQGVFILSSLGRPVWAVLL